MALSADVIRRRFTGDFLDLLVADNVKIYEGALVAIDSSGYAIPLSGAGQKFAGIAEAQADNTVTGHTAGGIRVRVNYARERRMLPVTGAAQNQVGLPVYASADGTLTMTAATGNQRIGICVGYESTGIADVLLTPFAPLALGVAGAVGANPTQAEYAALLAALQAAGLMNVP
jgi:hypothetical protein